ncbi:MAG: histone deacetylase family protein [Planctomycetota bacterium]
MPVLYLSHAACSAHVGFAGHPERPQRLQAIEESLMERGVFDLLQHEPAPRAELEALLRVHKRAHVERVLGSAPDEGLVQFDADTFLGPASPEAALRAAGAVVRATDAVLAGEVRAAFCAVRPPGHHATRDRAMGFCLFNNVAVGVAHALATGVRRLAVLDFDAHRGNGTEEIFADDPRVLFCSLYQHPFYPYGDRSHVPANVVDVPLAAGSDGGALRDLFETRWLPALTRHRPEVLFLSAGFDAHVLDEMSGLCFTDNDYAWLSQRIVEVATADAAGRVVSALEGGYHLPSLGRCVTLHVRALLQV